MITIVISLVALFVSIFVVYFDKREHHDLIAKVLRANFLTGSRYPGDTGELYVETGIVNRGNQAEIVRQVYLQLSETENSVDGTFWSQVLNKRIEKGDSQVIRSSMTNFSMFDGKPKWLRIGIVSIAPDVTDVETFWPVVSCNIATNGMGGSTGQHTNAYQAVQLVGDKRLPHQRPSNRWW